MIIRCFKSLCLLIAGEKDTVPDILAQVTFEPKYKTFEQDLMDEYNIKETRQRAPTFIY